MMSLYTASVIFYGYFVCYCDFDTSFHCARLVNGLLYINGYRLLWAGSGAIHEPTGHTDARQLSQ